MKYIAIIGNLAAAALAVYIHLWWLAVLNFGTFLWLIQ